MRNFKDISANYTISIPLDKEGNQAGSGTTISSLGWLRVSSYIQGDLEAWGWKNESETLPSVPASLQLILYQFGMRHEFQQTLNMEVAASRQNGPELGMARHPPVVISEKLRQVLARCKVNMCIDQGGKHGDKVWYTLEHGSR